MSMVFVLALFVSFIGRSNGETFVAIGNPGAGKSTILNCIAGEVLFKSGISIGEGMTFELKEKGGARGRNTYVDTPGISDNKHRKKAGEDISQLLKNGGRLKIMIFIREIEGRVVVEDITTMQMVLEAAPEIGSNFGIIVNNINEAVMEKLNDTELKVRFLASALFGMERLIKDFKPENIKYLFLKTNKMLHKKDDSFIPRQNLTEQLPGLLDFLEEVPTASLTKGNATDLQVDKFEVMQDKYNKLAEEFEGKKAEMDRKIKHLTEELDRQKAIHGRRRFFQRVGESIDNIFERIGL